jgi:glutaredoxin
MKKIIATSATCGPCHVLKARLNRLGITPIYRDSSNPEDIPWFRKNSIRNVPCLVIEDDKGDIEIIQGSDDIIDNLKADLK